MPEPLLTFGAIAAIAALRCRDSAMSSAARVSRNLVNETAEQTESSPTIFGQQGRAIQRLHRLAAECEDDENYAIDPVAVALAETFIRLMPSDLPMPEFASEPDGSVALDWIQTKTKLFSLSIGRSRRLPYAWLDGSEKGHGVAWFDAQSIPIRILMGIRIILPNVTSFRPLRNY